jgi:type I pantothenate kinase
VTDAAAAVRELVDARRRASGPVVVVVGIAGAVAAGKSVLAEAVRDRLDGRADVVSTDGFLLPNSVLQRRGLVERKGFPESYDVDALRGFLRAAREGGLPRPVPCYSHRTYDVEGHREVPAVDVLIVEGLNVLAAAPDLLDVGVYVDVDESLLAAWFRARLVDLWAAGRDDPTSFYASPIFAGLDEAAVGALADGVWRSVNLPNLREHIAPSGRLADLVITMGADHAVTRLETRDHRPDPTEEP